MDQKKSIFPTRMLKLSSGLSCTYAEKSVLVAKLRIIIGPSIKWTPLKLHWILSCFHPCRLCSPGRGLFWSKTRTGREAGLGPPSSLEREETFCSLQSTLHKGQKELCSKAVPGQTGATAPSAGQTTCSRMPGSWISSSSCLHPTLRLLGKQLLDQGWAGISQVKFHCELCWQSLPNLNFVQLCVLFWFHCYFLFYNIWLSPSKICIGNQ